MKSILIVVLSVLTSCQPSGKSEEKLSKESIAQQKFVDNINYLDNKNSTFTICYSQKVKTALNPFPPLHYFIFDNQKQEVIFEENLANGFVKWIGMYKIEVRITPGIVSFDQENKSNKYIYDVQLRKKLKNNY